MTVTLRLRHASFGANRGHQSKPLLPSASKYAVQFASKRSHRSFWIVNFTVLLVIMTLMCMKQRKDDEEQQYHIVSVIKPINTVEDARAQESAISSWLKTFHVPKIYLITRHEPSINILYSRFHSHRIQIQFIRNAHEGIHEIPLFSSVLHIAQNIADSGVVVLLNSDIHLSKRTFLTVRHVQGIVRRRRWHQKWFICSSRFDVDPATSEGKRLHTFGGVDFFAWPAGIQFLHGNHLPPFIWGRPRYDNWLLNQVIQDKLVQVIDVTEAAQIVHINHKHDIIQLTQSDQNIWTINNKKHWQIYINNVLAFEFGRYKSHLGTTRHAPYKLVLCEEEYQLCMLKRSRPGVCPCEYSTTVHDTQTDPITINDTVICGKLYFDGPEDYPMNITVSGGIINSFAHTSDDLAFSVQRNGWIILVRSENQTFENIMEIVCRLQFFSIHPIISTNSPILWKQLFLRSVGVIYERNTNVGEKGNFGEKQTLLNLLNIGYNVMYTNVHTIFRQYPLRDDLIRILTSHMGCDQTLLHAKVGCILIFSKWGDFSNNSLTSPNLESPDSLCYKTCPEKVVHTQASINRQNFHTSSETCITK